MACFTLSERVRLSIELALTAGHHSLLRRQRQEADARKLGMTGAEIDAARRGWSFEVRTSVAIALAAAVQAGDEARWEVQREKARRAGISQQASRDIEALAFRYQSHASRKVENYA